MKPLTTPFAFGTALLLSLFSSDAQTNTSASKGGELSDFKVIYERNIFNPKRSARGAPEPRKEAPKPARIDSISLVGIMAYEKGTYAFFDGSSGSLRKTIKKGDTIGGLELARIDPSQVVLRTDTNEVVLRVGSQLRREEGGAWKDGGRVEVSENYVSSSRPTAPPNPVPGSSSSASSSDQPGGWPGFFPGGPPPGGGFPGSPFGQPTPPETPGTGVNTPPSQTQSPPASGGSQDDILRRLMERRQQEQNR